MPVLFSQRAVTKAHPSVVRFTYILYTQISQTIHSDKGDVLCKIQ